MIGAPLAGLKMLFVAVSTLFGYMIQKQAMQTAMQQSSTMPAMTAGVTQGTAAFGVCLGLVWGWAFPVFMLIWFGRGRIKEDVAEWS